MKWSISLALVVVSLNAGARQRDEGFVANAGTAGNQEYLQLVELLGQINSVRPDELPTFNVGGLQLVAKMSDQIRQTIAFDKFGTAYLYYERLGENAIVRISKPGAAAEGYFEVDGWPYIISRGQVYALDDSRLKEVIGHLGRVDREHLKVIAKGATLGVATLIVGLVGSWIGLPHSVPAGVLAMFASGGYYGWLRRDRFKMTQMELGFAGNRFSKKIKGLDRVIGYKKTATGDVKVTVAVPNGEPKEMSMRDLVARGKVDYTHPDCEVALSRIRTMNSREFVRGMVNRLL